MDAIDFDHLLDGDISSLFGEKFTLKPEQKLCIKAVCCDNIDVFAQLPNGFGKSIIYQLIPRVKTALLAANAEARQDEMQQVVVVNPLVQIMQEQVKDLASHGMKAARIGESSDVDHQVIEGHYGVIFGNAEEWQLPKWKTYLKKTRNIAAFVVDEVHTVVTW